MTFYYFILLYFNPFFFLLAPLTFVYLIIFLVLLFGLLFVISSLFVDLSLSFSICQAFFSVCFLIYVLV